MIDRQSGIHVYTKYEYHQLQYDYIKSTLQDITSQSDVAWLPTQPNMSSE